MNFSRESEALPKAKEKRVEKLDEMIERLQRSISDIDQMEFKKKKVTAIGDVSKIDRGNNSEALLQEGSFDHILKQFDSSGDSSS